MHHKPEIWLVEAHAKSGRGDQGLYLIVLECFLREEAFSLVRAAGVGKNLVPCLRQERSRVFCSRDRETVDDARVSDGLCEGLLLTRKQNDDRDRQI